MNRHRTPTSARAASALALAALGAVLPGCAQLRARPFDQALQLPPALHAPAGHMVALELNAVGSVRYECQAVAGQRHQFGWALVAPEARLALRDGTAFGSYQGPPATWTSTQGEGLTASQLAVGQPSHRMHLPDQLLKADSAPATGPLAGVSHVQRVQVHGGGPPDGACSAANLGSWHKVPYRARYVFYRPV